MFEGGRTAGTKISVEIAPRDLSKPRTANDTDHSVRTLRKPLNFLNFDIDSLQTSGNMVVVASRKARRNDALDMFEAVSAYIYSVNGLKPALTNIEIHYSGKIIARRNGQANHCG